MFPRADSPAGSWFRSETHAVIRSRWKSPGRDDIDLVLAAVFATRLDSAADDGSQPRNAGPTRPGRTPWTTSRVVGSPDPPPPFKVVRAFPNLKFDHPLLIARSPGGSRLFVGEQAGVLYSFADKPDAKADLFFDLRKEIKTIHLLPEAKEVEAVYGLAFHPDFEKNRQCFVCYTLRGKKPGQRNLAGRHAGVAVHRHQGRPAADRPGERGDRPHLPAGRPQRRRPPLRPRRHALHLHRRRRQPQPARPVQHRAGHLRPALLHPAHRRGPQGRGQELRRAEGQPVRRHEGGPAGGLGLRLPQPLADGLRPPDRRAVRRRRRLGAVGVGPPRREGRQLRLVGDGGAAADQAGEGRADADPPGADRAAAHDRVQRHRRPRLPRQEVPRAARRLRLRRLGNAPAVGRPLRGRPHQGDAGDRPAVGAHRRLRRGQGRRAVLPRLRRRHDPHHRAERRGRRRTPTSRRSCPRPACSPRSRTRRRRPGWCRSR